MKIDSEWHSYTVGFEYDPLGHHESVKHALKTKTLVLLQAWSKARWPFFMHCLKEGQMLS